MKRSASSRLMHLELDGEREVRRKASSALA
jgi:hypothetical protein